MSDPGAVGGGAVPKRKLIEVALPLEAINRESAREKSIRHGHPSTLHVWWARRPLAAARAVLFAQLVDDPSSHPDRFPTEAAQRAERDRLHRLIEELVVWENARDESLLQRAHREILASTGGKPPPILDPFAGGGTIPLEAQRLGLEAHASDLNPVSVLINKALIEIPPKFADRPPVFPGVADEKMEWPGATGLAADVSAYGKWMRDQAADRIGEHYPDVRVPDGRKATVIAWIWARTVTCPNPVCGIEMPLVRSWWLGKKSGKEAWVRPILTVDASRAGGKRVDFEIGHGKSGAPEPGHDGTVTRNGAMCIACGTSVEFEYVRLMSRDYGLGARLIAVVAEGDRQRLYLAPDDEQRRAATVGKPANVPDAGLPAEALGFRVQNYGLTQWADLFTHRQLLAMCTLSDLVAEVRARVVADCGEASYADAVATYLGLTVSKLADRNANLVPWDSSVKQEAPARVFIRQTLSMLWDFAEANPLGRSTGNLKDAVDRTARVLSGLPLHVPPGVAVQRDASDLTPGLVSTDPPYYDNIGYSDLSDYFYIWLRYSLREIYPDLLGTLLVPKADELVANPYRHGGADGARKFFETRFNEVFTRARRSVAAGFPITVYYAFKQSEDREDGTGSTGWETLLDGMIRSGWAITATWPMRTEMANRMRNRNSNALASSIVLALRPRPADVPTTDRRGLIQALQDELPDALRKLQQGAIAPVDLPQAAIGPGMAVFSRYSRVIENDGSTMTVRSALARINEILDQVLNEQEGDFDTATRFAIAWYRQYGYKQGEFGVADNMARARNTSVETVVREGILTSAAGKAKLVAPSEYPDGYDVGTDDRVGIWEVLHHLIAIVDRDGVGAGGEFLRQVESRADLAIDLELVKELAFLLFSIAEKAGATMDALAFNGIATSWPEIVQAARESPTGGNEQMGLDLDEGG